MWKICGQMRVQRLFQNLGEERLFFTLLKPRAPPGYEWVTGRLTKCQKTSRPGHLWPEIWSAMGKKQQKIEIAKWEALQPKLKAARDKRGIWEIPDNDTEYLKIVSDLRVKLSGPAAPAMPLLQTVMASSLGAKGDLLPKDRGAGRQHQDKVADKGPSLDWFGLVHTPIPIPKALKVPAAREALHSEWAKLEGKNSWDIKAVRPKAQVIKEAKALFTLVL